MRALLVVLIFTIAPHAQAKDYLLFYLGGQSNMEGYGFADELPEPYRESSDEVMIFNGNPVGDDEQGGGAGQWLPLSPGFGTGYKANDDTVQLSDRFGPELSFGRRIAALTGKPVAIVKYARGGSSIALGASGFGTWGKHYQQNTGINQWDNFVATLNNATNVSDIDGDGEPDTLTPSGIIWMQGEADAYDEAASKVYLKNLATLMQQIASEMGDGSLPVILGKIEDSGDTPETRVMPYIESVWEAQRQYAANNANVERVALDQPVTFLDDKWHYHSRHYIELGKRFAERLYDKFLDSASTPEK